MGRRSGAIRIGVRNSVDSIHRKQCCLLIVARDASPRTRRILEREAAEIPTVMVDSEIELGTWLGMQAVAAASVVNHNLASGILRALKIAEEDGGGVISKS